MIVTLIVISEIGFWVLLAGGLALRYLARKPRAGAVMLASVPVLDLVLLAATAVDLHNGATASVKHGLAAVYIGFSVAYGHYLIKWADGHFAHRFAGGPKPVKPPRYGSARSIHEWKQSGRAILGAAIAAALLQAAIWYVGDAERTEALASWQGRMGIVTVISLIIALSYTVWPKREPAAPAEPRQPAKWLS